MELFLILKNYQRKLLKNQILFSLLIIIAILFLLLNIIVGFFINRLVLLLLIPVIAIVIYKSEFFKSMISYAQCIEQMFPEIKNKFVPAIELFLRFSGTQNQNTIEGYSQELIDAAILQATQKIKKLQLNRTINYKKTRFSLLVCLIMLLIFFSQLVFYKDHFNLGWHIAFNPKNAPLTIDIAPGNIFVDKDSLVSINYMVKSPLKTLRTTLYAKDKKFTHRRLSFLTKIPAEREFSYRLVVHSNLGIPIMKTPIYKVRINQPIQIDDLVFTYFYPAYTYLGSIETRSNILKAIKGTKVGFKGTASMPLLSAVRISANLKPETLSIKNNTFHGGFVITKEDSFEIVVSALNHRQGRSQRIFILPSFDEIPFVKIFLPGQDIDIPVNMQVLIGMQGLDDFGITRFDLAYTKSSIGETIRIPLKSVANKAEDTLFYLWNLTKLNLLPGEEIDYFGVVYDNDIVSGYKSARSETYTIRFPTLAEIYDKASQFNRQTTERLEPIRESQTQLSKELEKISKHIQQYRTMDWEEKSKVNEILAKQEELMSEINAIQQEINNTIANMYAGLMLDKETLDRLREISEIMSQILPDEIKQRLKELHRQLQEKNPDITKALENFKMSSEEIKQALERALELLKNIQKQEQLNNLARKAEEIYKQQSALNTRMESEKLEKLVPPQNQIGNEIQDLQDEIQKLSSSFKDSMVQAELKKIAQELNEMQLNNQTSNLSKSLSQNNRSQSKKSAAELLKDLQKLKERLRELAGRFNKNQNERLSSKLLKIAIDINNITSEQENIKSKSDKKNLTEMVVRQKRLSSATNVVAETLAVLSGKSLFVSPKWIQDMTKAVNLMDSSAKILENAVHNIGDLRQTQNLQADAISQMNTVALQILYLTLQGRSSDGMKSGMESLLEALSQLTADQMALGQQMGGMMPLPIPGGLTPEQMSQLGRLLSMQSQLRSQLEQLMQEINSGKYGQLPGMTGSMEGAMEDMKQIEKDLSELNIHRKTIERQEQVINKLLDAQRSIRQKEYSEKREREIGKDYPDRPNIILDKNLGETKKLLREELLRALREGYPKEYESMIKNYFEELLKE